ncbi:MAG: SDR family oxidoreductase [Planctomycetes bacterium]|nr:SDR family oxidoreductase [Planctomycetota bacterium]
MKLRDQVAIVTGASRGVGRAVAIALAEAGCSVLINYAKSREAADETLAAVRERGAHGLLFPGDVADDATCRAMVQAALDRFGRLDVLVNNAGTTEFIHHRKMEDVTDEIWDRIFAVNLKGPFQMVRAAREALERDGGGAIVNVASVAGLSEPGSSLPYGASKAALINLTVNLARALGPHVRVNAVAPGFIEGDWLQRGLGRAYERVRERVAERTPLHRVCRPEDVAAAILSLLQGSELVTGQTLVVDGGHSFA